MSFLRDGLAPVLRLFVVCVLTTLPAFKPALGAESALDYDRLILLDAEDLAELGIVRAYERLKPVLTQYVAEPAVVTEHVDHQLPGYSVSSNGVTYAISAPRLPDGRGQAWGRATFALFQIVNRQLDGAGVHFYAINGGNELGGMFLTGDQVRAARRALHERSDWPYLPTLDYPWYGQYH